MSDNKKLVNGIIKFTFLGVIFFGLMMHLSKFFNNTDFLIDVFFFNFHSCWIAFSDFIVITSVNLLFFMRFKVQFPVMRRYVYVLRPKADNLNDVFCEETTN